MSDKSKTPTGVFVRLPLSEEEQELLVGAAAFGQPDDSHDTALLGIGTPVAGRELEAVCSIDADILRNISDLDDDDEEYVTDMVFRPGYDGTVDLVRQSDHQAALAAAQAEIVRLLGVIRAVDGLIMGNNDPIKMFVAIHSACQSALKGPAA